MTDTAVTYHWSTAYDRYNMTPHFLDWANQPDPFKEYPDIEPIRLPELTRDDLPALSLERACQGLSLGQSSELPKLIDLASIFTLACGLTAKARQPNGDFFFRSAPSAGALYPNEVYLAWPGSLELKAGIYHYSVHYRGLSFIQGSNVFPFVQKACAPACGPNSPLFIISGIFFRSAWKYRARAYRYLLLDGGHLLENLRLAIAASGFLGTLAFDFNDTALNQILSLDVEREVCLAGIGLTIQPTATADSMAHSQTSSSERSSPKSGLALASRVSSKEVHYEVMTAIHRAGEILPSPRPHPSPSSLPFEIPSNSWRSIANKVTGSGTLAETVLRRRSHRNFVNRPMSKGQFDSMLNLLCQTQAVVTDPGRCANIVTCGCLVGNVTDTLPGFYLLDTTNHKLAQVCAGEYRTKMTAICLDQAWLANAAVHMVLMADLAEVDWVWGPRGYRYAMMTAGRLGHTVYLAATALGLGCCGIGAFYDKEAAQILGLDNNTAMLYLLAVGQIKKSIS